MLRAWRGRNALRGLPPALSPLAADHLSDSENARLHERKQLPTVNLDEVIVSSQDVALALNDGDPEMTDLRRAMLALPDEYQRSLSNVLQVLGGFSRQVRLPAELGLTLPAVLTKASSVARQQAQGDLRGGRNCTHGRRAMTCDGERDPHRCRSTERCSCRAAGTSENMQCPECQAYREQMLAFNAKIRRCFTGVGLAEGAADGPTQWSGQCQNRPRQQHQRQPRQRR